MLAVGDRVVCTSDFDSDGAHSEGRKLKGVVGVVTEVLTHGARIQYPEGVWPVQPYLPLNTLVPA